VRSSAAAEAEAAAARSRVVLGEQSVGTETERSAELVGIDSRSVYARATAIAVAIAALGGLFLGIRSVFDPVSGPTQLIFAFEAVVIGGMGSLWGTLFGGIITQELSWRWVLLINPPIGIATAAVAYAVVADRRRARADRSFDLAGMTALVTDEMLDRMAVAGTAEECREQVCERAKSVDRLLRQVVP